MSFWVSARVFISSSLEFLRTPGSHPGERVAWKKHEPLLLRDPLIVARELLRNSLSVAIRRKELGVTSLVLGVSAP